MLEGARIILKTEFDLLFLFIGCIKRNGILVEKMSFGYQGGVNSRGVDR